MTSCFAEDSVIDYHRHCSADSLIADAGYCKLVTMARPEPEDRVARAVQVDLFRKASASRRFELACSLSKSTIELARDAIRRRHPEWPERDVLLEFARIHYGVDLAERVRVYLALRTR